ncbi:MAG: RagB/SusD family nutrient uptake outer membrane protein [Candidatus Cryptobacteroides sp.]
MNRIYQNIIFLFLFVSMTSCSFLDKEPYTIVAEDYFTTEEEASDFLTSVYSPLAQASFYGNNYMVLAGGDDLSYYGGGTTRISNSGLICNNATVSDPAVTSLWATLYNGIERANIFIESIGKVEDLDPAKAASMTSQVRFLRAYYYFILVSNWGDVPFITESTYSSGNVYDKSIARTDKNVIYDFIVKEMAEAAQDANPSEGIEDGGLPTAAANNFLPGYVSKSAAWGILARVYLFWAGEWRRDNVQEPEDNAERYRLASYYGQKVMTQGHSLADEYWDVFIDISSGKYNTALNASGEKANESIWEVEFAGDGTGDVRCEGRIGNTIGLVGPDFSSYQGVVGKFDPGYSYGFIRTTPKLYDLYKENGDLERFTWNVAPFTYRGLTNTGVIGRTFESEELYKIVTGQSEYGPWYECNDYDGDSEGKKVDNSKDANGNVIPQYGDVFKANITEANLRKDICCGKYRREYETAVKKSKNNTAINFPILRYSDVLLMIAEAENEYNNGPTPLAVSCLNAVRARAGLDENASAYTSRRSFLNAVKDERAMELCFEYTRRYDLIRWGDYVDAMHEVYQMALSGENWGEASQAAPFFNISQSYNYFPIPEAEMAVNKLITQNNPGW